MSCGLRRFAGVAILLAALTPAAIARAQESARGRVAAVVDGDTIRVDIGAQRTVVRLLGVDTPELHDRDDPAGAPQPMARAAADFTRGHLGGRQVRLEFEPGDRFDHYGRTLAYVFLEDGTFFNRELLRLGYAHAYTRFAGRYRVELDVAEAAARQARLGVWGVAAPVRGPIIANRRSRIYHVPGQTRYDETAESNRIYFDTEDAARAAGFERALR
jgi:micrococcal nuclease